MQFTPFFVTYGIWVLTEDVLTNLSELQTWCMELEGLLHKNA